MRKVLFSIVFLTVTAFPSFAQNRHLGATGAKVFQCIKYYRTVQGKLECVEGREVEAQVRDNIDFIDSLSRAGRSGYGNEVANIIPGETTQGGGSSTSEKVITGAGIGAGLGYAVFGNSRGTAGSAAAGALAGLIAGHKSNKNAEKQAQAREAELQVQQQARAQQIEIASKEQKLLRNRFDARVRLYFRSEDGRIAETQLTPGETRTILLPRESALIIAEVENNNGKWIRLEDNSGMVRLPRNAGWEFANPSHGS